jgi:hypothetical protein
MDIKVPNNMYVMTKMSGKIQITRIIRNTGYPVFSGIVLEGQIIDQGWSKLIDSNNGKISEIRPKMNSRIHIPVATPNNEYFFICGRGTLTANDGDEISLIMTQ